MQYREGVAEQGKQLRFDFTAGRPPAVTITSARQWRIQQNAVRFFLSSRLAMAGLDQVGIETGDIQDGVTSLFANNAS